MYVFMFLVVLDLTLCRSRKRYQRGCLPFIFCHSRFTSNLTRHFSSDNTRRPSYRLLGREKSQKTTREARVTIAANTPDATLEFSLCVRCVGLDTVVAGKDITEFGVASASIESVQEHQNMKGLLLSVCCWGQVSMGGRKSPRVVCK